MTATYGDSAPNSAALLRGCSVLLGSSGAVMLVSALIGGVAGMTEAF
ncbi:hypothetical protein [Streptomyces spiralis]